MLNQRSHNPVQIVSFPNFLSSHSVHLECGLLKGVFKRQRVLLETKFTSAVLVAQHATANGRNSVPAGPLQTPWPPHILPGAWLLAKDIFHAQNIHRNICNLHVHCGNEMQFQWKMQLLILYWMSSMFWSVWSREDHSRSFIFPVGWSL